MPKDIERDMQVRAIVRTRFELLHRWPDAPDGPEGHLRNLHRHELHVQLEVQQYAGDREVEYLRLKRELNQFLRTQNPWPERTSCEDIAVAILRWVSSSYPGRSYAAAVFEDGENGCRVEVGL